MAMRCHYDVLGIEKTADDASVRKAYRKMALQWHPDKNQDRKEEAEEKFKEICNAYEVLSDPHERAWYDSHRDQILRSGSRHQAGDTGGNWQGGQKPADEPDLFSFFNSNAYSGYNDGPRGFYTVYADLFYKLGQQEQRAYEQREDRQHESIRPPPFGKSDAPWSVVSAFYEWWGNFASFKDFAWADEYNMAAAPNRRYRRAMEEENKKARNKARREYNDEVRELVSFLRKRDRRVLEHRQREAERAEREKKEQEERKKREKEERRARAAAFQEADWVLESERRAHEQFEREWMEGIAPSSSEEGEDSDLGDEGEGEGGLPENYCVACDKAFKSAQQLANHERSKKHQDQVRALRRAMQAEDALLSELGLAPAPQLHTLEELEREEDEEGGADRAPPPETAGDKRSKRSKKQEKERKKYEQQQRQRQREAERGRRKAEESETEEEEEEEELDEEEMLQRLMGMKLRKGGDGEEGKKTREEEEEEPDDSGSAPLPPPPKSKGAKSSAQRAPSLPSPSESESEGSADLTESDRGSGEEGGSGESEEEEEEDEEEEDVFSEMLKRAAGGNAKGAATSSGSATAKQGAPEGAGKTGVAAKRAQVEDRGQLMGLSSDEGEDWGARGGGKGAKKGVAGGGGKKKGGTGGAGGADKAKAPQPSAPPVPSAPEPLSRKDKKKARKEEEATASLRCQVCKQLFESRTKLFAHIRATGHAALKQ